MFFLPIQDQNIGDIGGESQNGGREDIIADGRMFYVTSPANKYFQYESVIHAGKLRIFSLHGLCSMSPMYSHNPSSHHEWVTKRKHVSQENVQFFCEESLLFINQRCQWIDSPFFCTRWIEQNFLKSGNFLKSDILSLKNITRSGLRCHRHVLLTFYSLTTLSCWQKFLLTNSHTLKWTAIICVFFFHYQTQHKYRTENKLMNKATILSLCKLPTHTLGVYAPYHTMFILFFLPVVSNELKTQLYHKWMFFCYRILFLIFFIIFLKILFIMMALWSYRNGIL